MAAGLGFKEFTTGDVLTAADANGYLASQVVMVFASAAARTSAIASPQEGMMSYLKDTNAVATYDGAAWVTVGGGGGGKVLQVIQATTVTEVSNSTNTYTDTGLTATITPSSATSTVLVLVSQNGCSKTSANSDNAIQLRLLRGATNIIDFATFGLLTNSALRLNGTSFSVDYLDSPATTSATTYKTQFNCQNNSAAVLVQSVGTPRSTITLLEIGA
jgi:hypothetical protein